MATKNLSDAILRKFMDQQYTVTIELLTGNEVTGELITITNKNNYILKR